MTKACLVEYIAENADLTKADAARALEAVMEGVTAGLKESGKVTLVGFGTFTAKEREAGGVLDMDTKIVSTLTSHDAGYLDPSKETIVGIQTDAPFKNTEQMF